MAHRALLACRRSNGAYDVFGHDGGACDRAENATVTALSSEAVFDHVEYGTHESLTIREGAHERNYVVVSFALSFSDMRRPESGGCIAVRPEAGLPEPYLRGWAHAIRGLLGDAVSAGRLEESRAKRCFADRVRGFEPTTEVIVR